MSDIDDLIRTIRSAPDEKTARTAVAREFGGERLYVPHRLGRPSLAYSAQIAAHQQLTDVRTIMRTLGVGRSTAYKILKQRTR